jgi:erythromycin esterase
VTTEVSEWFGGRAVALSGLSPGSGTADLQPFADALAGVRVIGLGEATHGSREFFLLKHRMLEFLVTEQGFTVLAMEASAAAAIAVDDYVLHGEGDPAAALHDLGFWTWNTAEMLAVLRWLREHNSTVPAAARVSFVGIDPQCPGASLAALRAGTSQAEAALVARLAPLGEHRLADDAPLKPDLLAAATELEAAVAGTQLGAHARTVRQYAILATRPMRHADPEQTFSAARDEILADNVDALLTDAETKVALWAHNGHVMTGNYSAGTIPAMGSHLRRRHGDEYYALGVLFGEGEFLARRTWFGRVRRRDRPPVVHRIPFAANKMVVEATLKAAHSGPFLVDLRGPTPPEPVTAWLHRRNYMRGFGSGVGRFTYKTSFMQTVLAEEFDGIAYVPAVGCSTPLD